MIQIERYGNGFRLSFKAPGTQLTSFATVAKNVSEIKEAVEHHYSIKTPWTHVGTRTACPLCRLMASEREKKKQSRPARRRP